MNMKEVVKIGVALLRSVAVLTGCGASHPVASGITKQPSPVTGRVSAKVQTTKVPAAQEVGQSIPVSQQAATTASPLSITTPQTQITLPVASCDPGLSLQGQTAPTPPSTVTVSVDSGSDSGIGAYSNGFFTVIAPAGWSCFGSVGPDGTTSFYIYPPDQTSNNPTEGVFVNQPSTGTASDFMGCTYFPSVVTTNPWNNQPCSTPSTETVTRLNQTEVYFEAPPNDPNGYPTDGVVFFDSANVVAVMESCSLPDSQRSLCKTILNDFSRNLNSPDL